MLQENLDELNEKKRAAEEQFKQLQQSNILSFMIEQ